MLKKLKQQRKQKKQNRSSDFQSWKGNMKKTFAKKFPAPQLDKPTTHLVEENYKEAVVQSAKTTKQILKFWLIGLVIVVLGYMLYISLSYIYMLIAAFIISLALEGCIIFWQRITKRRGAGILITYLIATIFVLSGFIILVPFFFNRGTELLQSLMTGLLNIEDSIAQLGLAGFIEQIGRLPGFIKIELIERIQSSNSDSILMIIKDNIGNIMTTSSGYIKIIASQAFSFFGNFFIRIADLAIVLTLCIFFSIAHYDIKYALKYILRHFQSGRARIDAAYSGITVRLKSQLFLCVFIGIASYAGLRILELFGISIPQKFTLAVLAGLFEIIPYIGPFLGAIPAGVSALIFSGRWGLLAVVILYTIIQQTEEKFLVPVVMGRTLGVSPLLVFISILLCGTIMGFFGVLFAVPIAVIVAIAFRVPGETEINERKKLFESGSNSTLKKIKKLN